MPSKGYCLHVSPPIACLSDTNNPLIISPTHPSNSNCAFATYLNDICVAIYGVLYRLHPDYSVTDSILLFMKLKKSNKFTIHFV